MKQKKGKDKSDLSVLTYENEKQYINGNSGYKYK